MKKKELYKMLEKFESKDMILVNNEVIVENCDLNDDWFELNDYAYDEEIGTEFEFERVNQIDFNENYEKFETDTNVYETEFSQPTGCVVRFNVLKITEK